MSQIVATHVAGNMLHYAMLQKLVAQIIVKSTIFVAKKIVRNVLLQVMLH